MGSNTGCWTQAWANFKSGARADLGSAYERFRHDEAHWLEDYALFQALRARFQAASYLEWPAELARREPAALDGVRREMADEIDQVSFAQFLFFARARGLRRTRTAREWA